jgi:alpha-L-fucosidase
VRTTLPLLLSAVWWVATAADPIPLTSLSLQRIVALEGDTHHVQGIETDGVKLWVTSVDRNTRKGYLLEYALATGKRLRAVEVQQGDLYHPGGLSGDATSLWLPVAEYRRDGRSVVEQRSKVTLNVLRRFEVGDHIGAVAASAGHLYGANWDARRLYTWTFDGEEVDARANPHATRYQDLKFAGGRLVASGLTAAKEGAVEWLDPTTLEAGQRITAPATERGVPFNQEGMAVRGNTLYLLPEDAPSRLFVYSLEKLQVANNPDRLEWFRDLGFGMFIHWNVDVTLGSVISHSLAGAAPDYVKGYFDVLPRYFYAERFNPAEWARLAKLAGMKYVVFTSKHHAGFTWWDSKTTPFNVMNTPLKRDVVKAVLDAFRAEGIAAGLYISPDDFWWFHQNGFPIARPPAPRTTTKEIPGLMLHGQQQLRELLGGRYGKVDVLFIDGPADGMREEAWRQQADLVVTRGAINTPEQQVPGLPMDEPWEACITIGSAWQHKPADVAKPTPDLIEMLIEIRAKGGNLLLNVGPRPDGTISLQEEARLRDIALWNFVNGESLEAVRPWILTNEGNVWFTRKRNGSALYAFVTRAPWKLGETRTITLKSVRVSPEAQIEILGQSGELLEYRPEVKPKTTWTQDGGGLHIRATTAQRMYDDRRWANPVVFKITHAEPALQPPQVATLDSAGGVLRGAVRSMGDAARLETGFEYRSRKGLTDLYERDDPWKPLPAATLERPGVFTVRLPAGVKPEDVEFRAYVKHPLLTLYGAEKAAR